MKTEFGRHGKKRTIGLALFIAAIMFLLVLAACGQKQDMAEMESVILDSGRGIVWEDRTYELFCVVSKRDCGKQIGYVDGDTDDRVSEYKDHAVEEWIINWIPTDGGAMLLKEQSVDDIPEGLEREY